MRQHRLLCRAALFHLIATTSDFLSLPAPCKLNKDEHKSSSRRWRVETEQREEARRQHVVLELLRLS